VFADERDGGVVHALEALNPTLQRALVVLAQSRNRDRPDRVVLSREPRDSSTRFARSE
jgi:hypothetical protein